MSNIKKCDICGLPYEPYGIQKDPENPNGFSWLNIQPCSCGRGSYYVCGPMDTCEVCRDKIRNFIASLIEEANKPPEDEVTPPEEPDGEVME